MSRSTADLRMAHTSHSEAYPRSLRSRNEYLWYLLKTFGLSEVGDRFRCCPSYIRP